MRRKVWKSHGKLIFQLAELLKGRGNVNKMTISLTNNNIDFFWRVQSFDVWLCESASEEETEYTQDEMEDEIHKIGNNRGEGVKRKNHTPLPMEGNQI